MTDTGFELNQQMKTNLAKGYVLEKDQIDDRTPTLELQGRGYKVPNGGMYSTVDDLARFVAFELGEGPTSVLKKENLEANYKRIITVNARLTSAYGIGFIIERKGELLIVGHGGTVAGYDAIAACDRASRMGIVILHNVSGGPFNSFELLAKGLKALSSARR